MASLGSERGRVMDGRNSPLTMTAIAHLLRRCSQMLEAAKGRAVDFPKQIANKIFGKVFAGIQGFWPKCPGFSAFRLGTSECSLRLPL